MRRIDDISVCAHLTTEVSIKDVLLHELILDEELGITDSISRCRRCNQLYLLELLDLLANRRLFRISMIDITQGERLLKNMANGSCDLDRAQNEIHHLKTSTAFADVLLELNMATQKIVGVHPVAVARLPTQPWRLLVCDGSWFSAL